MAQTSDMPSAVLASSSKAPAPWFTRKKSTAAVQLLHRRSRCRPMLCGSEEEPTRWSPWLNGSAARCSAFSVECAKRMPFPAPRTVATIWLLNARGEDERWNGLANESGGCVHQKAALPGGIFPENYHPQRIKRSTVDYPTLLHPLGPLEASTSLRKTRSFTKDTKRANRFEQITREAMRESAEYAER